ncbi:MAG: ribosome-associated translation inhibitor RaiA [Oscillospiraceae bacterium]|jgi:putative sigma-54 modulation protein|nr:ribosome-associated translation inhibitor RaiA [Oscillospiraceae bacterium]
MKITIVGRKCTPRDSFKERAEKKLAKVEKFFGDSATAKVTATAEKTSKIVEITINNEGMIFRAEEHAEDMVEALDACIDALIRQIRKNKTRVEKKLRSGAFDDYLSGDPVPEETEFEIVRTKSVPVKPQTVEEAILQMNLLGHQFYLFTNAETNHLAVVYRRKGQGYGLIEPEK